MTVKKNILPAIENKTVSPKAKPPLLPSAFAPSAFLKCFVRGKLLTLRTKNCRNAANLRRARPTAHSQFAATNLTTNHELRTVAKRPACRSLATEYILYGMICPKKKTKMSKRSGTSGPSRGMWSIVYCYIRPFTAIQGPCRRLEWTDNI